MSSKYAEYDARAAEADKRISELAARVAAMEKAGGNSGGGDAALKKENEALKKQVAKLEAQIAGMKKAGSKKDKPKKEPKAQQPSKADKKAAAAEEAAAKKKKDEIKAAKKEGGKKGQDICGLNEMGGVMFFHLTMDNSFGRWDLIELSMEGFNTPVDPSAEDRKGGAGHLGKCLLSAGEKEVILYAHVPAPANKEATAKEWVSAMLPGMGKQAKIIEEKGDYIKAVCPGDEKAGLYPLKMRDTLINQGFEFLKKKKLVIDAGSDDDVDYGALAAEGGVEWGGGDY
jgi:hypothetical protein